MEFTKDCVKSSDCLCGRLIFDPNPFSIYLPRYRMSLLISNGNSTRNTIQLGEFAAVGGRDWVAETYTWYDELVWILVRLTVDATDPFLWNVHHFLNVYVISHTLLRFRHVIVGRNFGSYVTHETKHFIYFYLGQVAVLLFKSGWKSWDFAKNLLQ